MDIITQGMIMIAKPIAQYLIKYVDKEILGEKKNDYQIALENVIYSTMEEFSRIYGLPDRGQKIMFYQSDILLKSLLSTKFIGRDSIDFNELKNSLEQHPNIITPSKEEVIKFIELFEQKCKTNQLLVTYQYNTNYKEAVFEILKVVDSIYNVLNQAISEIRTGLTSEYFAQLKEIEESIETFMPLTALNRLENIEKRIQQANRMTPEIETKILFLKGKCLLASGNRNGAELVIKAYIASKSDSWLIEAAIAYLNLDEIGEAKKLANKKLLLDPFSGAAWLIKLFDSDDDFMNIWNKIPKSIKAKPSFRASVMYHVLNEDMTSIIKLQELEITLPDNITNDDITYSNIGTIERIAYVKIYEVFTTLMRRITIAPNGKSKYLNNQGLEEVAALLKKFFDRIHKTEVYGNYALLRFHYFFSRHLLGDNSFDVNEFEADYLKLKDHSFEYELEYAIYKANLGKVEQALNQLNNSKYNTNDVIFFHRIIFSHILKKEEIAQDLLKEYIDSIDNITFGKIYTLQSLFGYIAPEKRLLEAGLKQVIEAKSFASEALKELFQVSVQIKYSFEELDKNSTIRTLLQLAEELSEKEIRLYIGRLLWTLKAYKECGKVLEAFIEEGKQTEINMLYAVAIYNSRENLVQLLPFLKRIREENTENDYNLLYIEEDIRHKIDDFESIIDILWRGVKQYSEEEHFHVNLLVALERQGHYEQMQEYVLKYFKSNFKNEEWGISICHVLGRNGFKKEAAELLFNLACIATNHNARTTYVAGFHFFPEAFLIEYDTVEKDYYVKLIDDSGNVKLLQVDDSDKYKLIGKRKGESILFQNKIIGNSMKQFHINRIMNKALYLLETIFEEAKNPNTDLNLIQFDGTGENGEYDHSIFEKKFIETLGVESESENNVKKSLVEKYQNRQISFAELSRNVFNMNMVECYQHLTSHKSFIAIPDFFKKSTIPIANEIYAIDFTSLILFSQLKSKYGIVFPHKFVVSPNLVSIIRTQLIVLQSSPKSEFKIGISNGRMIIVPYPEDHQDKQIALYTELDSFIKEHCEEKSVEIKADLTNVLSNEKVDIYANYVIDNSMYAINLGYTFISNDNYVLKYFPSLSIKQISPELFLQRNVATEKYNDILNYFVENRYVGVSLTQEVLSAEYNKKLKGQENHFQTCIENLTIKKSRAITNITPAISFIRDVYLNSLTNDEDKDFLCQTIFTCLLDFPHPLPIIVLIESLIQEQFKLLGRTLDRVMRIFQDTLNIYRTT